MDRPLFLGVRPHRDCVALARHCLEMQAGGPVQMHPVDGM